MYYFKVIPFGLMDRPLLYKYPEKIRSGTIVDISIRNKKSIGVVLSEVIASEITFDKKKFYITELNSYIFKSSHLDFIEYLSKHYFIDLGMSFKLSIGSELNLKKKIKNYLLFQDKIYENKKFNSRE